MQLEITCLDKIDETAREFIGQMGNHTIFAFYGKMGAGKTTFIKAVCRELGVEDNVNSPSFAIINEYRSTAIAKPIYHFDFYRIKKIDEVFDLGYEEYFYSDALCFIEWPELIEELLPEEAKKITITENSDGSRTIVL
ncbi:MAG TPA: tRNA (adenosine(37)-N6)-threonylcarbamoyltransferase complex ATPase subunit type 1 TsaE [Bacteroidaceae bacterium]|jgi:tRNA threonylcarbamoyladenosine biosynthesis protein TsaE|nr:tRNA (adenosine(37)-N6)-threonylcarbamoyltransferase complex ATPase subunit type 1 TsaE [Bacteroidaceae bacterium]MBP8602160.1 tRNA (adenosine(37)-N6)-threonylcarbamoyltransferase complex ATPase subunit type 1 TsaE [Bacteroidaceae bacterium]HOD69282.1 tRNA (adenosine(37)-N6)-threonylcarbamoyltransferase complex ATPase subunit type 1 TsaE [Bacteroidaceae bacterium]HPB03648.1 tRNA (adenosine(37)-N6)-threonylcarbamoyltransferase complex ATPase subunit type 1 TsaE [Bacteroidaceae bacterium]HQL26